MNASDGEASETESLLEDPKSTQEKLPSQTPPASPNPSAVSDLISEVQKKRGRPRANSPK